MALRLFGSLAAAGALAAAMSAGPAGAAPAAPLTLKDLAGLIGTTREALSAAPPAGLGAGYQLTCTPVSGPTAALSCAYRQRAGKYLLKPDLRFAAPPSPVDGLQLLVVQDRVAAVRLRLPGNDFNDLYAQLQTRFGAPARIRRTRVRSETGERPQVVETWRAPTFAVVLTDPSPPTFDLELDLTPPAQGAA